jgi:NCS1 family nucleobase:cation symporter-1
VPVPRWTAAVIVGLVGGVVSYIGRTSYYISFENFLFLLGYWLAPWAAIVLVDFFWVNRGHYPAQIFYNPRRWVGRGLWSWAIGVLASVPFFNQSLYQGPIASHYPQIGDVSYYVSFIVAGVVYWAWSRRAATTR